MPVSDDHFRCQCIYDTLYGLQEGLTHFSQQPSRVALIYAAWPGEPMRIYDPLDLLLGHGPMLKKLFLEDGVLNRALPGPTHFPDNQELTVEGNLDLTGLISCGGRSQSLFYQMWFAEHHPDICHIGPTERWLEQAAFRLSHAFANPQRAYTGISGHFLREYATHAVSDCIGAQLKQHLGMDAGRRIFEILCSILDISRTQEEGSWPRGELLFVHPGSVAAIPLLARFPEREQPLLANHKHVCKLLLASEGADRKLVSDGQSILGIAADKLPPFHFVAEFCGGHGFIRLKEDLLCSFFDGAFHASTMLANLVQLEEALLEANLDAQTGTRLFQTVSGIVHQAQRKKHGCSLVLDLNEPSLDIAGQDLAQPLDLMDPALMELAKSLAMVDGALHIGTDLHLNRFACLLDGRATGTEDPARGARFNSAVRFSAERPGVMVVVVSSDREVYVIQEGIEINAQCQWTPSSSCLTIPPTLEQWLGRP